MAYTNSYDKLYKNMRNRLTVVEDRSEYTLGEYMTMKADLRKNEAVLPQNDEHSLTRSEHVVVNFISYINDKLTVKETPARDKTIRAFPFRTSASAILSAVVACTFMLSFGIIGAKLLGSQNSVAEPVSVECVADDAQSESETTVYSVN